MYIEERVKALEENNARLQAEIEKLKQSREPQWHTTEEFSERFDISLSTIYRLIRLGDLASTRVGKKHLIDVNTLKYTEQEQDIIEEPVLRKRKTKERERSVREKVFGI